MHGGRPAVPTDPNSPRDHKQPLSNYTKEDSVAPYYYPPRERFPLPQCFHNPTGICYCSKKKKKRKKGFFYSNLFLFKIDL